MTTALRVGLIGAGAIARRTHLPGFSAVRPAVDLTAFASRSLAPAQAAAEAWGGGVAVSDWRELIGREDVDAVDVCTPNALHAPIAIAAARAGKHVLVEKPLATSLADADAMIEAARRHGVVLMTAQNGRYGAGMRAAAQAVRQGRAGDVRAVEAWLAHGGPGTWARDARWFFDPALSGGGALLDLGVHAIDAVRAVTGDEFALVSGMLSDLRQGVEWNGHLVGRLAGGGLCNVKASWNAPFRSDRLLAVWGTDAQVLVDGRGAWLRRPDDVTEALPGAAPASLFADFVAACRSGPPAGAPTGDDGRAAVAVVLAAYRSHGEGRAVAP